MTADLAEFLLARVAETEREAVDLHVRDCDTLPLFDRVTYPCNCGTPQWVLAECAAKRAIIGLHQQVDDSSKIGWTIGDVIVSARPGQPSGCIICDLDRDCGQVNANDDPGCQTLRLLAAVHRDHAEYQPEWAPQ